MEGTGGKALPLIINQNLQKFPNLNVHGFLWKPVNGADIRSKGVGREERVQENTGEGGSMRRKEGWGSEHTTNWQETREDWDHHPSSPASREPHGCLLSCPRTTNLERHTGLTHVYILHMLGTVSPSTYKVLHQFSCSPLPSLKFLPGIQSKYVTGRKLHTGLNLTSCLWDPAVVHFNLPGPLLYTYCQLLQVKLSKRISLR